MKKEKLLLDAIGDIDDRFVLEAMPERAEREAVICSPDLTDDINGINVPDKSAVDHPGVSNHVIYMKRSKTLKPFGAIAAAIILIIGVGVYMTVFRAHQQSMTPSVLKDEAAVEGALTEVPEEVSASDGINEEAAEKRTTQPKMRVLEDTEDTKDNRALSRISNPWTDSDTLEDAMANAGFDIVVPETFDSCHASVYRSMTEKMLEIIYVDKEEDEVLRIRKSTIKGDISGDYNNYETEYDVDIKSMNVTIKGNASDIYNVTWSDGTYSFAITVSEGQHFDEAMMRELIDQIS